MQRRIVPDIVQDQSIDLISPETTVSEAVRAMTEGHFGAVLVGSGGELAGIFTERDLLTRVVDKGRDPGQTQLQDVMTRDPDCVAPDDTALEALERMRQRGYRHLPVMKGSQVVGIVSIRDLYAAAKGELEENLQQQEAYIFGTGYGSG